MQDTLSGGVGRNRQKKRLEDNTGKWAEVDQIEGMLRWTRGEITKDHIKNEVIWREANIEPVTTVLRKKRRRWYGHVLRKDGEYHQEDVKHASAEQNKKRRPKKIWLDNIRDAPT